MEIGMKEDMSIADMCLKSILLLSFGKKTYSWNSLTAMEIGIEGQDGCFRGSGFHDFA